MAQLEVNFTFRGEVSETTFVLQERGEEYYLIGNSAKYGKKEFKIEQNDNKFSFNIKPDFEETNDIIEERMVGLTEEWIGTKSQGFDLSAEEIESTKKKPGYGPQDIFVESKNFTLTQLVDMVNEGDLELAPRFQRNFIWDRTRKSRLIESIFLGLPLPTIYLSQYDDGRLTIVDGLQRINSIKEFMEDGFALCNMEYFDFCNGKKYSELNLPSLQLRRFKQTVITCFVIDYRSPAQLKYDLFRRLNTGGKVLNDQEIRNCLARTPLQNTLYEMVNSNEFKQATCGSVKDTRMAAQESALRFIYFYDQYSEDNYIGNYDGDMKSTLDACIEELNEKTEQELNKYVEAYRNSMSLAYRLFGDYAFRKVYPNYEKDRKPSINKSLMLAISVLLAKYAEKIEDAIKYQNFTNELAELIANDNVFNDAISWSTTNKKNIKYVFTTLKHNLIDRQPLYHGKD